jgi:hypothetical protein
VVPFTAVKLHATMSLTTNNNDTSIVLLRQTGMRITCQSGTSLVLSLTLEKSPLNTEVST